MELSNTEFYLCATHTAKESGDEYDYTKFKALKKVDMEHAEAIIKLLKIIETSLKIIPCSTDFKENTQESCERENRAIELFLNASLFPLRIKPFK